MHCCRWCATRTRAWPASIEPSSKRRKIWGLPRRQIFRKVELPLALPVLLAGLRIVMVQAIGLAVVAALVGAGGLGTFVFQGLGRERGRPCPAGRDTGDPAGACRGLPAADGDCLRSRARRAMIDLQEVGGRYGDRRVVDRVSLSVAEGEFCVLIGPSGCGKSTTVKMINRLVPLTAGSIRIGGEDVMRVPIERLRRRIGYAIQSIGLFPHWTVEDNIATVPRLLRWPGRRVRDRVTELLELLRLDPEDYRAKYPQQLSGGQQQRVGVARALAADPEVLLMDEPSGRSTRSRAMSSNPN